VLNVGASADDVAEQLRQRVHPFSGEERPRNMTRPDVPRGADQIDQALSWQFAQDLTVLKNAATCEALRVECGQVSCTGQIDQPCARSLD
jgi:hypothetical protein